MRSMGRPRQKNKDLPLGLYRDAGGRHYLKAYDDDTRARLGGKASMPAGGRDVIKARTIWAEVFGFRLSEPAEHGSLTELFDRFETEDLVRVFRQRGQPDRPKYAPRTQKDYKAMLKRLRGTYGTRKYARSEAQAALGGYFRTMDVSAHLRAAENAGKAVQGNRDAAVLGSVFRYAKESGLTEYNPCLGATRNTETPREAMPDNGLFLELWAAGDLILRCMLDVSYMVGCRESDLLKIMESDWNPALGLKAVPGKVKRGQRRKKQLFEATPDLIEVIDHAKALKRAALECEARRSGKPKMASVYLFCNPKTGEPYTVSGFQSKVKRAKVKLAKKRLGAAATPEQIKALVREIDHHHHDVRARAIDDAKKSGQNPTDFAAHSDEKTTRIYTDRGVKTFTPNPRIRAA